MQQYIQRQAQIINVTSCLETFLIFESIDISLEKFGLEETSVSVSKNFSLKKRSQYQNFGW